MPLTEAEKEKIIETEILRNEIQRNLKPQESGLSDFQKQLALLLIGFFCTAVVGGTLTYWWKQREWINEQKYLKAQRALDRRYALIEKTFKEVASTLAGADDELQTFYGDKWTPKELESRRDYWDKTSRDWRVNSQVISQDLAVNFVNAEIQQHFQEIVNERRVLGRSVINLLTEKKNADSDKDLEKKLRDAQAHIEDISKKLHECGALMARETAEAQGGSTKN
jgi:hypothetical protein